MARLLIGLCGKKGSGKTYIANHMNETHDAIVCRFADTIKCMMKVMGFNERQISGDLKEKPCEILDGKTPRYAMQTLGTEWGRDMIHKNIWVNIALARTEHMSGVAIFDDVRFPNEIEAIHKAGGVVAWVERSSIYFGKDNHPSEISVTPADCDIFLDNTIDTNILCSNLHGWAELQKHIREKKTKQ
tara:strand:+ start:1269 stop:1829 length:561 start_codon:yes stop_codon:yes gene_type:complete